jgi:hypothetical protein
MCAENGFFQQQWGIAPAGQYAEIMKTSVRIANASMEIMFALTLAQIAGERRA